MATDESNNDCYFYYYSSCANGDECEFRHCEAALGTETVCSAWRRGSCYRENCKFRHMESRIKRATIPCFWENQPGGCLKPHCVFLHNRNRPIGNPVVENQGLILPVSTQAVPLINITKSPDSIKENALVHPALEAPSVLEIAHLSPHSNPVEPVVVNFDDGEDSDVESLSNVPVILTRPTFTGFNGSMGDTFEKSSEKLDAKDFGIKTLEQIRMEKIHKESEHFYKSDALSDPLLDDHSDNIALLHQDPRLSFPVSIEVTPLSDSSPLVKERLSNPEESTLDNCQSSSDLRSKIKKRQAVPTTDGPAKKVVNLKKSQNDISMEASLGFKIKTLEEIRKDREKKLEDPIISCPVKSPNSVPCEGNYQVNEAPPISNRRKIKMVRESIKAPAEVPSLKHEKSPEITSKILNGIVNEVDQKGKRKEVSAPENAKKVKLDPASPRKSDLPSSEEELSIPVVPSRERCSPKRLLRPIIRRSGNFPTPSTLSASPSETTNGKVTTNSQSPSSQPEVYVTKSPMQSLTKCPSPQEQYKTITGLPIQPSTKSPSLQEQYKAIAGSMIQSSTKCPSPQKQYTTIPSSTIHSLPPQHLKETSKDTTNIPSIQPLSAQPVELVPSSTSPSSDVHSSPQ